MLTTLKGHIWHINVYFSDQKIIQRAKHPKEQNFEDLAIQKSKMQMDRAQIVDEKNGVICLVMFVPGVMVIKMSKLAHFLYFLLMPAKCRS